MENFDVLSCTGRPKAQCQSVRKADDLYRSSFTTPGMDWHETGSLNSTVVHRPLCVYHLSTGRHSPMTRSPRPSPAVFRNTGGGNGLGTRLRRCLKCHENASSGPKPGTSCSIQNFCATKFARLINDASPHWNTGVETSNRLPGYHGR